MAFAFAQKPAANRVELKRITNWVEDALPESMADVMVMVNELQCYEPVQPFARTLDAFSLPLTAPQFTQECAPLETVVSLLGERSLVFKIFKPAELVTPEDVMNGVRSTLTGAPAPAHLSVVIQQSLVARSAAATNMQDG